MKKWEKYAGIMYLVVWVVCGIISIYMWWRSEAEVYAYKHRAQVAAEAEDVLKYLERLKEGMEKWGMTKGHYALIFKTPWNDAGLDYIALTRAIERVKRLIGMDKSSVAYQTGMDDVRGIIRELEMDVFYFWALHTPLLWGFVVRWIAIWSWLVVLVYICARIIYAGIKEDRRFRKSLKEKE